MNLFTAQKHASFAAKLFTAAGFDFEKALAANDADALKNHIAAQNPAAVSALFTTAGLNLDTLLAAGPESLKAHLDGLAIKAEQFTALETKLADTEGKLGAAKFDLEVQSSTLAHITTALALPAHPAGADAAAIKTAFDTHVQKQVTLANAKMGHPPVVHIDAAAGAATLAASDAEIAETYSAMPRGPEKLAFYQKHTAALHRVYDAQNRRED